MFGGNPSLRAGTRVYTSNGIFPIEQLDGQAFDVRNLDGKLSPARCRKSGIDCLLYRIRLRGGHEYFATAEHEWPVLALEQQDAPPPKRLRRKSPVFTRVASPNRRQLSAVKKVPTNQLESGMRLPVRRFLSLDFGDRGTRAEGFLAGWLLGDGSLASPANARRQMSLIVNEEDHASGIASGIEHTLVSLGSRATFGLRRRGGKPTYELSTWNTALSAWLTAIGLTHKSAGLPTSTWTTASEEFRRGLLDGLFSADGMVDDAPGSPGLSWWASHRRMSG